MKIAVTLSRWRLIRLTPTPLTGTAACVYECPGPVRHRQTDPEDRAHPDLWPKNSVSQALQAAHDVRAAQLHPAQLLTSRAAHESPCGLATSHRVGPAKPPQD